MANSSSGGVHHSLACYYIQMSTPIQVQLKREHHAPSGDDARVFLLLSRSDHQGKIQQLLGENPVGPVLEVNLKELRRTDASAEQEALARAVRLGHNRVVDKMLRADPLLDPNGSNVISLLSRMSRNTPNASANRVIKTLLAHGADINHQAFTNDHGPYWTPLWNAVHDDQLDEIKRLLDHGATFDLPSAHPQQKNKNYTVLHLAASCGLWETFAWLLDQPQCPKVPNDELLYEFAGRQDRVDPVSYDEVPGNEGVAVPFLHFAASGGIEDPVLAKRFVEWLLESGEQWEALDHNGETALEVSRRLGSGMSPIFGEMQAKSQAGILDQSTLAVPKTSRRPRM